METMQKCRARLNSRLEVRRERRLRFFRSCGTARIPRQAEGGKPGSSRPWRGTVLSQLGNIRSDTLIRCSFWMNEKHRVIGARDRKICRDHGMIAGSYESLCLKT